MRALTRAAIVAVGSLAVVAAGVSGPIVRAQQAGRGMRLSQPRIAPLPPGEWTSVEREAVAPMGGGTPSNSQASCVRHPTLCHDWLVFTHYVAASSTLPPHDRELLVLRTTWLCSAEGEWGAHARSARRLGFTDADVRRVADGPSAWTGFDATLVGAADELHADQFLSEATWQALAARYTPQQMMDTIFTVGQYTMVSMWLNSAGIQPAAGVEKFPPRP